MFMFLLSKSRRSDNASRIDHLSSLPEDIHRLTAATGIRATGCSRARRRVDRVGNLLPEDVHRLTAAARGRRDGM